MTILGWASLNGLRYKYFAFLEVSGCFFGDEIST